MPPAGITPQCSREANLINSDISSISDGVATIDEEDVDGEKTLSSPTMLATLFGISANVFLCGKAGSDDGMGCKRVSVSIARPSPQPRSMGTILPGLQRPSGSKAARTLSIALRSASEKTSG